MIRQHREIYDWLQPTMALNYAVALNNFHASLFSVLALINRCWCGEVEAFRVEKYSAESVSDKRERERERDLKFDARVSCKELTCR